MELSYILNHLGEDREQYLNAVTPPIFQSSNFTFKDTEQMRMSLTDELDTPFYTRGCNPTVAILRKKIAALCGAEDSLIFGSGTAAISAAVMSQVKAGDHIICVAKPYGWTEKLMQNILLRFNVEVSMVDGTEVENFKAAIKNNTKLIYLESPNSMTFDLQDIEAVVKLAKDNALITIMDNSWASPYYFQPIKWGIDISVHSASKYLNGHSDIVAGVLAANKDTIRSIFYGEFMNLGGVISPHDAWLMIRGLRTLELRMQHVSNTSKEVIKYLDSHPKINKVLSPFSNTFPQKELAKKYFPNPTGLFSIEVKSDSIEGVERFSNALNKFLLACSWGGYESLVFPCCVFYKTENEPPKNLPWNLVRLCIGYEKPHELIADLEQALKAV